MPVKLSTTLYKIEKIENIQNRFLVKQYHKFMDSTGASCGHLLRFTGPGTVKIIGFVINNTSLYNMV